MLTFHFSKIVNLLLTRTQRLPEVYLATFYSPNHVQSSWTLAIDTCHKKGWLPIFLLLAILIIVFFVPFVTSLKYTHVMPSCTTLLWQLAQQLHALLHSNIKGGSVVLKSLTSFPSLTRDSKVFILKCQNYI